ncbi:MAG: alpha-galactosidase, partial [Acidobacteriia bacterium]|nr:alpha-galactosidase [Terriglobia bacterium]
MRTLLAIIHVLFLSVTVAAGEMGSPTPEEMGEAQRWAAAKFAGQPEVRPARGYLEVSLAHGPIEKNAVKGHSLLIFHEHYRRGLYCPSEGEVVVHLPQPGRWFEAVVGVDSNDVGYYSNSGRGSVIASVEVGGKEVLRSAVVREGLAGVPVKVDLQGAREFTLKLSDAGQGTLFGNDFNQADWAEARVTLNDGKAVWLDDLPVGPLRAAYTTNSPFSFTYGGRPSSELLKNWRLERRIRELDAERTETTLTYTDPQSGLVLRAVAVAYRDFPSVEWTLYFKNAGTAPTPILENIQALDTRLERDGEGEFLLHHNRGSSAGPSDYAPIETPLRPQEEWRLASWGGRPSDGEFPYFNVAWPGEGVIVAVGWPGQWSAAFTRDPARGLRIRAGQELTHLRLLPGEEVRSPLIVMQFWKGDWIRGQNLWRRWMIAHNLPRPGGKLPPPQMAAGSGRQDIEMQGANEEGQKKFLDLYQERRLKIDYWWMDAGWYPFQKGWWNVGTWAPDPQRFPRGLRPIADYVHARGVKIIVWMEPERVTPGTELFEQHPDWLLGREGETKLLDLGNPLARAWLIERADTLFREQGMDLYRQDFNIAPLQFWRDNDSRDRQGITENRYVTGFLTFWDELRRRHPNLLIDTCASGGRRNDLETLRRAVPLWRSDYAYETTGMQDLSYGLALWVPFF